MSVPFLDVRAGYEELKPEIDAAVSRVLSSGRYILGDEVETFERDFARYCGAAHCVGVANGLDALVLALRALDIGAGDEVIVPAHTFIATWLAVSEVGATLVPVEPDPQTYNIDPGKVTDAITEKTRAIIPVHLYGQPADLKPLLSLAHAHGLKVIEDAAQAHGAGYCGARLGGHGDVACWSFYPGKNLGAFGDAGCVTTHDPELAARIARLGNYGSSTKYINEEPGKNSRMDPIQAAILGVKLAHLDRWTQRRREIAHHYSQSISGVTLPYVPNWADPVWHLFVIQHPARDALQAKLEEAGVSTVIHYPVAPHRQAAYAPLGYSQGDFPLTEGLADRVLSLPIGPHMSDDNVATVVDAVNRFA